MCDTMRTLQRNEEEQRVKCYGEADPHLQALHGQYALDAMRVQRFHGDLCEECLQEKLRVRPGGGPQSLPSRSTGCGSQSLCAISGMLP
jgi:hypothetical protein